MPANDGQERTEEATPRRRQDARRKGTVAKSTELTNAIVLLGLLIAMPAVFSHLGGEMVMATNRGFGSIPTDAGFNSIRAYTLGVVVPIAVAFLPFVAIALFLGLFVNFAQVGFVLSGEAMSPSLSKINPFEGFKRLFSARSNMEGLKALLKSSLFVFLGYGVVASRWGDILNLSALSPLGAVAVIGSILQTIVLRIGIAWLALAVFDYWFQRKQVDKQLRMSKDEVKREFREMETSPELKAAMMQRRRKLGKRGMAQAIKDADVIITNPTHYAVAIKYDRETMYAPQVVAKGVDYMALRIRQLAGDSRVPIVPNPPLARQLYKKCDVGDFVPRDMFQAVAEVLAYVYTTMKNVKQ
ncbi:MAG TPA: flagellar biosynthesis protein FlhB [Fimbriimonadaceae bacterium]|nr:flagellar biosynthesis protein FlhB [Fimbriimonadaceae bacterium]